MRDDQARRTRRACVDAAATLFVERGYAATTIDAIAERAGVSRRTVFAAVGGKADLLKLAWDWTLVGDDEPVDMEHRPAVQAMLAETDPSRLVERWVVNALDVGGRAASLGRVLVSAGDADPQAAALLEEVNRQSLAGARAFVAHLAKIGGLRAGLAQDRAADIVWAHMGPGLFHRLYVDRGWSLSAVGDVLCRSLGAALLPDHSDTPDERRISQALAPA
ncbi:MAG: helix-turn-helix domain-containing protein [Dermatophilaceae bacterium]